MTNKTESELISMKVDPKKLNFTCKMAKMKAKQLVSMKMGIQNMKLIIKMANKTESELISMKLDPNELNFTIKIAKKKAKKLVSMKMGIHNMKLI